jgi:hypothetical protein
LKPQLGSMTNDPAGFTIQAQQTGPGLFVTVDPATLSPMPAVGDVVDFTITQMGTVHMERRAQAIDSFTRVSQGADVSALATDVSSVADFVTNIGAYDGRLVNVTGTFADAPASSGTGFEKLTLNTAAVTGDTNFQFRGPATLVEASDFEAACQIQAHAVPVGRYDDEAQIGVYNASDFTITSCPAPAVVSASAVSSTSLVVTFSRHVDPATVTADATQFTAAGLTLSNPLVNARTVTLTTSAQSTGADYDVVVANTVKDTRGVALATSLDAHFAGFIALAGVRINEVNAHIGNSTNPCDMIELRVISDGTMAGYKLTERNGGSGELTFTFPAGFIVHKNDFIVVHDASGSSVCNPGGATSETASITGQPAAMYANNFDTAFDFWAPDNGLTDTDNVFTLYDSSGAIIDALLASNDPAGTSTASASESAAAKVLAANQWSPPMSATDTYIDANFRANAADDLDATSNTSGGTTMQRVNDADTNAKADWTTGAGAAASWGALNPGQSALP